MSTSTTSHNRAFLFTVSILTALLAAAAPAYAATPASSNTSPPTYHFTPLPDSVPSFACHDSSYAHAVKDGVTLGIEGVNPYDYVSTTTHSATGIDWDINVAVLHYVGITKIHYTVLPFDDMIPALLSGRIDVITADIHETASRDKEIAFTTPAWWYGPAIVVKKDNPDHITSFSDLGKVPVAVEAGSAAMIYMQAIHGTFVPYPDVDTEMTALAEGRQDAVLEDIPKAEAYVRANPGQGLEVLQPPVPTVFLTTYGYGYARYGLRKNECTLNAAISYGLGELRSEGVILSILERYGLGLTSMYLPGTQ